MNTLSFKERQQLFQKSTIQNTQKTKETHKINTSAKNDLTKSLKNNPFLKLVNEKENKKRNTIQKENPEKLNTNISMKEHNARYDSNKDIISSSNIKENTKIEIKNNNNINLIKMQMEQLMMKKMKEKELAKITEKNKDKDIKIQNDIEDNNKDIEIKGKEHYENKVNDNNNENQNKKIPKLENKIIEINKKKEEAQEEEIINEEENKNKKEIKEEISKDIQEETQENNFEDNQEIIINENESKNDEDKNENEAKNMNQNNDENNEIENQDKNEIINEIYNDNIINENKINQNSIYEEIENKSDIQENENKNNNLINQENEKNEEYILDHEENIDNIKKDLFKIKEEEKKEDKINNINENNIIEDENDIKNEIKEEKKENEEQNIINDKEEKPIKELKRKLSDLDIDNFKDFKEEYYLDRKYDKTNYDKGKIFFKYRYLKSKYNQINETINRLTRISSISENNLNNRMTSKQPLSKKNKNSLIMNNQRKTIANPFNNNYYLSFFIQNSSTQILNSIDKDSELRHYHSEFLKLTENSILYFNLKKYEESYLYLFSNDIIKSVEEFGEFLLVGNGYDKFIIGEFLSKAEVPNENKKVLKGFINGIKMNYDEISFLDVFRFLMKRFYLPKDANLILKIMSVFCETYFENNKKNQNFLKIFKNSNNIYLLVSTLLAVNTMFTRSDIKNINLIKKAEFITMNKNITEEFLIDIYDKIKKHPLEIELDNYNEDVYRRMSALIKENISNKNQTKKKSFPNSNTNNLNINNIISTSEKNIINGSNDENDDNDNDNEIINDYILSEHDFDFSEKKNTYDLTKNLYNFNKQDQDILLKIYKFKKFVGNEIKHEREFSLNSDFTKLIWCKNLEGHRDRGNLHTLLISDIIDIFNGIEKSEVLKKYIKTYPNEIKDKNCFITIITTKREINLKANSLTTGLLWYKALKSLVLKIKGENMEKNSEILNEMNTKFKLKLEELWKKFILPKWNIYGNYILLKLKKRNELNEIMNTPNNQKSIITILKDIASDKILDFNDFFRIFKIGLPPFCRGTIWRFLIGNSCSITETLYENYINKIEKIDFGDCDARYHIDINAIFNMDYSINQMIIDVIKEKDLFKEELIKLNIDQEQIMTKCYNILRVFYLIRNDLIYKKSILPLIFVFLIVEVDEFHAFCNIYNLICNNDIFKFYSDDESYIMKSLDFFASLVEKNLPKIDNHFKNLGISHDLYFIPWITEIFSSSIDLKLLLRIIDLYLIEGEYILYQTGLSILSIQEDDLLDLTINEIFILVKRLGSKYKEKHFLRKMKNFEIIVGEYFKWKNENDIGWQKLQLFQAIFNDD